MRTALKYLKEWADLLIVLLIAIAVRAYYLYKFEFWFDEAFTGILMRIPFKDFVEMVKIDTNPAGFYVFARFWSALFGTSEISLRTITMLAGVATVFLAYVVGKKLFNKETGVVAALLLAISPFMVQYSVEARAYAFYGFFALLSFYALYLRKYLLFALFTAFIPFLHYTGIFYSAVLLGMFMILQAKERNYKVAIPVVVAVILSIFLSYQNAMAKTEVVNSDWVKRPNVLSIKKSTYSYLFGVKSKQPGTDDSLNIETKLPKPYTEVVILGIYALLTGIVLAKKPQKRELLKFGSLATLTFVPLFMAIAIDRIFEVNVYVERYLFPSSVFFLISFAYLLKKTMQFEIMMMFVLFYAFLVFARLEQPKYYFGMRNLTSTHRRTVNHVTFTSPMDYVIGRYYFGEDYKNIRLYDPKDPTQKYLWWPFVRESDHKVPDKNSLLVVPDDGRLDDKLKYIKRKEHGSYVIYTLMPGVDLEREMEK